MKRVIVFLMAFVLIAMVQGSSNAKSEILDSDKASLKDVESFDVLVVFLSDDAKSMGLSRQLIQSKVELQLRKNGLPVVDEETKSDSFGEPGDGGEYLYVNITVAKGNSVFAYAIDLEFQQIVKLDRNGAWCPGAKTWDTGYLGLFDLSHGKERIIESLLDMVDIFSNAFVSVNGGASTVLEPKITTTPKIVTDRNKMIAVFKAEASDKWGEDYQMVNYEVKQQTEAYDWVVKQTKYPAIISKAKQDWGNDYVMVKYEYKKQAEAYEWVNQQTAYPKIMSRAKQKWGNDYVMVKYEYENQVKAYKAS